MGLEVDIEQLDVWFCDFCLHLEKQSYLRENGHARKAPPPPPLPSVSVLESKCSEETDPCAGPSVEASGEERTEAPCARRIKKRKKTNFRTEKKSKKKRQMQISAVLTAQVLNQNRQRDRHQPTHTVYNWEATEGVRCYFCRLPYGVFMQLDKPANTWGHLSCGYWLPFTTPYMPDRLIYLNAKGTRELNASPVPCAYCRSNEGILAECFFKGCGTRFHVECGRRSFCELKFPYQLKMKQKEHAVFCFPHSQTFNARRIEQTVETEWTQMKNVLKSLRNHHMPLFHNDVATQARKVRARKLLVNLKRVQCGRDVVGFAFVGVALD